MNLFFELLQEAGLGSAVQIITLIKAPPKWAEEIGQQALLHPDGTIKGCIIDEEVTREVRDCLTLLKPEQPQRFCLPAYAEMEFFCDRLLLPQRAVVFGGGCAEAEVKLKALSVLDQSRYCVSTVSLFDEQAAEAGMVCGGIMDVFIQAV